MSETAPVGKRLRIMVVDDHDIVHWGLRVMLERLPWVERSYSAHSGADALAIVSRHDVDVALVDLFLGSESGPEVCEQLRARRPELRVLLISGSGQISSRAAVSCGASGFVSKDLSGVEIVRAIRAIAEGSTVFDSEAMPVTVSPSQQLSEREHQVLALMAAGATNREIAAELHLSPHTVKEYASSLYRKLEVRNRLEAVTRAEKLGMIA